MTGLSRRKFLQLTGLTALMTACTPLIDTGLSIANPLTGEMLQAEAGNSVLHLLNRVTFGVTPELVQDVNLIGVDAWLEQQFDYRSIYDVELQLRLRRLDTLNMSPADLLSFVRVPDRRAVANQLASAMLLRAVYSRRQLYEKMVHFWSDHFSIYYFKDRTSQLQTVDDREVIRPHALGTFGDLLRASAHSPAMLIYLDNVVNEKSHPNENYAREIMELHTIGVNGAYTEFDVLEVARCFTGWSVSDRGTFEYRSDWHDDGEKIVLGHTIPAGGGKSDGDRILDILIEHPDTAHYVSEKLLRRFVADAPSQTAINDIGRVWMQSQGDIVRVMRAILVHETFDSAPPKFQRPLEYVISALRVLGANYDGSDGLVSRLDVMGHRPFAYATPDGYPDTAGEWIGSFTPRWNFALDLSNDSIPSVSIPVEQWTNLIEQTDVMTVARAILQNRVTATEEQVLNSLIPDNLTVNQSSVRRILAVLLSSPAFQWR